MSNDDVNHFSVLLEQIVDQNKAVLEYVSEVPKMAERLRVVEGKVEQLQSDMHVVKAAVNDLSGKGGSWPPKFAKGPNPWPY